MGELRVSLLGAVRAEQAGAEVVVSAPLPRALLALLALHSMRSVQPGEVIDGLWSDPPASAANAVQRYVSDLRRALGRDQIVSAHGGYRLLVDAHGVDARRFVDLMSSAEAARRVGADDRARRQLDQAMALWEGDALSGLPDVPFVAPARNYLQTQRDRGQLILLRLMLDQGEAEEALPMLEGLTAVRPFDESIAALLVRALGDLGRPADALMVYEQTRAQLGEELGLDVGAELSAAHLAVLRRDPAPATTSLRTALRPLPARHTELVARGDDLRALRRLIDDRAALVTMTGPGGVGKTRLALELAHGLQSARPVLWLELAALTRPEEFLVELGAQLSIKELGVDAVLERVARVLQQSGCLIVVDNFEHLAGAASDLARLREVLDPTVQVVVTSRVALDVAAEQTYAVRPLAWVADPGVRPEAVTLFVRCAARVTDQPSHLDDGVVVELCRKLDGLPLAIELAAARTRLLNPADILQMLDDSMDVVGGGPLDAPVRHRSLRACIEGSVGQLSDRETLLFRLLAVFVGGADLNAVRVVCAPWISDVDLIDSLDALVKASLLTVQRTGSSTRLAMLETIRGLARERLDASQEREVVAARHAEHFRGRFTSARAGAPWPPRTGAEFVEFEAELPNIQQALRWLEEHDRSDDEAALALTMGTLWYKRGDFAEVKHRLERILSMDVSAHHRAVALSLRSVLLARTGDWDTSSQLLAEALQIAQDNDDAWAQAQILGLMASDAMARGDSTAAGFLEGATAAVKRADDPEHVAWLDGLTADPLDERAFTQLGTRVERIARQHHNDVLEELVKSNLSWSAAAGDSRAVWRLGARWGHDAADLSGSWSDIEGRAIALANAATCELLVDETASRTSTLREAMDWSMRLGNTVVAVETMLRLAASVARDGDSVNAAGMAAAAVRLADERGEDLRPINRPLMTRYLDPISEQLGGDDLRAAVAQWEHLDVEQCVARALAITQELA